MQTCDTAFGALALDRYPPTRNPTLQPFDAADLYLLQEASTQCVAETRVLVVNDQFGALAVALAVAGQRVTSWSDSCLAELALQENLRRNGLAEDAVQFVNSQSAPPADIGLVLLRIPKSLSLLQDQLGRLGARLPAGVPVLCGAMIKHLPPSAGDHLERLIGPYQASLAWKKARLLRARTDEPREEQPTAITRYRLADTAIELDNLPGVFSRERLDIGTRALLPAIPTGVGPAYIIDLGCGNGALGIQAALGNPEATITFIDESHAAVASARCNFERAFADRTARFLVADGLADGITPAADLILCNPPFHQQQVIGDEIAMRMFRQAHDALSPGGRLLVVGNRHLGYHLRLRQLFGDVHQRAATAKFVVLEARRR
jgi:23S rRNA (guanine1835-N2)-methyltransferase